MVIALKKVRIKDKTYFLDTRLKELRNIKNPYDTIVLDDFDVYYFNKLYKGEIIQKKYGWLVKEEK